MEKKGVRRSGFVLALVCSLLIGIVVYALVWNFRVKPSTKAKVETMAEKSRENLENYDKVISDIQDADKDEQNRVKNDQLLQVLKSQSEQAKVERSYAKLHWISGGIGLVAFLLSLPIFLKVLALRN